MAGELAGLRRNPPLVWLLVVIVGGWLFLTVTRPEVLRIGQLHAGDCLYIRAADANTDTPGGRAIGSELAATAALYAGGAERSSCDATHSHEVALTWTFDDGRGVPYPGLTALDALGRDRCEAAFTAFVGRPTEGSALTLVIAVPTPPAWEADVRGAACLVERRDGTFLTGSARGSGS